jgi:hypothetical protein
VCILGSENLRYALEAMRTQVSEDYDVPGFTGLFQSGRVVNKGDRS